MNMFGRLFGRSEAPRPQPAQEVRNEVPNKEVNQQIMLTAIAEQMWNLGMGQTIEGSPEEKKARVQEMAAEALTLAPDKYLSLTRSELEQNKHHLVETVVDLYQTEQQKNTDKPNDAQQNVV